MRRFARTGLDSPLTATRDQLDLGDQPAVNYWFRAHLQSYVFLVAGTVGGSWANSTRPTEFIYDNLMIHAYGPEDNFDLGSSHVLPALIRRFDDSKPGGTPRKLLDFSRLHALGWRHTIELRGDIASTYPWFVEIRARVCGLPGALRHAARAEE